MDPKQKMMDSEKQFLISKSFTRVRQTTENIVILKPIKIIKEHNSSVLLSNWMGFISVATGAERFLIFSLLEIRLSQSQQRDELLVRDETFHRAKWHSPVFIFFFIPPPQRGKADHSLKDPKSRNDHPITSCKELISLWFMLGSRV